MKLPWMPPVMWQGVVFFAGSHELLWTKSVDAVSVVIICLARKLQPRLATCCHRRLACTDPKSLCSCSVLVVNKSLVNEQYNIGKPLLESSWTIWIQGSKLCRKNAANGIFEEDCHCTGEAYSSNVFPIVFKRAFNTNYVIRYKLLF